MKKNVAFRAYVANLGMYNEGYPVGEWVDFPITYNDDIDLKEAVNEVLCRIRVDGMEYEEYCILDYDSDISALTKHFGKHENLFLLNYLAHKIIDMKCSIEQFEAMLAYGESIGNAEAIINLIDNAENFLFMPDVKNDYDLGVEYAKSSGLYTESLRSLGMLADYIDYEGYGSAARRAEGGIHTDTGYICLTESIKVCFNAETDGIPEE